ncbi:MAG TPA: ABC transporter permease [Candidatus Udaeobacter sp.]|jgi:putative ABC transport system permease protein|nr:ABC transporter permease [Candidatus Udaeobacter sp.]
MTDLQYALRQLAKSPGFTAVAVLTLALGIGANSAVFGLINGLLVKPLPYQDSSRLVLLWEQFPSQGLERIPVSVPEYLDYEKQAHSFERIAAFVSASFNLKTADLPERVQGAVVSPSVFPLLGIEPIKGRTFAQEEFGEGRDDVVVISERLWKRRFNSDPALIGNKLYLNGRSYTVIGIMPARFEFPLPLFNIQGMQFTERADIWKPIAFTKGELESRGSRSYGVIARLRADASVSSAQAEVSTITADWKRQHPKNYGDFSSFGAKIYPLQQQVAGGMRDGLFILLGAVALVLLVACANLATMLLARASARERELAIRVAVGASPSRLLRQMLTESVTLALIGGTVGVLLAVWGLDVLKHLGARTIPRLNEVTLDWTVLFVTASVAIGSGILFGLIPALSSARPELTEVLKEGGRGSTSGARSNRVRNGLVIAEIALALVLLIGAGLLMTSFMRLQAVNPGFDSHNVLTMELALPQLKYPPPANDDYVGGIATINFFAEARRRIANLPGVGHAAFVSALPLSGSNNDYSFVIEGRNSSQEKVSPDEEIRVITPDYFRVLQTPLLKGRFFSDSDTVDSSKVIIINRAFARKYWPNEDALGKRISFSDQNPQWTTVVGIVGDIKHRALDLDAKPEFYVPHTQLPSRFMVLAVRSSQDPRTLTHAIRRELLSIDPDQPVANVRTLEQVISDSIGPRRMSVLLLGVFAGVALLLASVGIYGVMSYLVVQRTHEIGVRMALGAQARDVLALVIGHALKLVGIGTGIGLLLALISTRALSVLLYGIDAFDLATFVLVTVVLATIALLASYLPALRASRADPMIALGNNG